MSDPQPPLLEVAELWGPDPSALIYAAAACAEGDPPLDQAILRHAAGANVFATEIDRHRPRVSATWPDPEHRRTAVLRADGVLYVKGDVEAVLPRCFAPGAAEGAAAALAARGLRVVAVAAGASGREERLMLWGLIGLRPAGR